VCVLWLLGTYLSLCYFIVEIVWLCKGNLCLELLQFLEYLQETTSSWWCQLVKQDVEAVYASGSWNIEQQVDDSDEKRRYQAHCCQFHCNRCTGKTLTLSLSLDTKHTVVTVINCNRCTGKTFSFSISIDTKLTLCLTKLVILNVPIILHLLSLQFAMFRKV